MKQRQRQSHHQSPRQTSSKTEETNNNEETHLSSTPEQINQSALDKPNNQHKTDLSTPKDPEDQEKTDQSASTKPDSLQKADQSVSKKLDSSRKIDQSTTKDAVASTHGEVVTESPPASAPLSSATNPSSPTSSGTGKTIPSQNPSSENTTSSNQKTPPKSEVSAKLANVQPSSARSGLASASPHTPPVSCSGKDHTLTSREPADKNVLESSMNNYKASQSNSSSGQHKPEARENSAQLPKQRKSSVQLTASSTSQSSPIDESETQPPTATTEGKQRTEESDSQRVKDGKPASLVSHGSTKEVSSAIPNNHDGSMKSSEVSSNVMSEQSSSATMKDVRKDEDQSGSVNTSQASESVHLSPSIDTAADDIKAHPTKEKVRLNDRKNGTVTPPKRGMVSVQRDSGQLTAQPESKVPSSGETGHGNQGHIAEKSEHSNRNEPELHSRGLGKKPSESEVKPQDQSTKESAPPVESKESAPAVVSSSKTNTSGGKQQKTDNKSSSSGKVGAQGRGSSVTLPVSGKVNGALSNSSSSSEKLSSQSGSSLGPYGNWNAAENGNDSTTGSETIYVPPLVLKQKRMNAATHKLYSQKVPRNKPRSIGSVGKHRALVKQPMSNGRTVSDKDIRVSRSGNNAVMSRANRTNCDGEMRERDRKEANESTHSPRDIKITTKPHHESSSEQNRKTNGHAEHEQTVAHIDKSNIDKGDKSTSRDNNCLRRYRCLSSSDEEELPPPEVSRTKPSHSTTLAANTYAAPTKPVLAYHSEGTFSQTGAQGKKIPTYKTPSYQGTSLVDTRWIPNTASKVRVQGCYQDRQWHCGLVARALVPSAEGPRSKTQLVCEIFQKLSIQPAVNSSLQSLGR